MNTSMIEKAIFMILAGLVSFLIYINQGIQAIHDDLLVLRTETNYTVKELAMREQVLKGFNTRLDKQNERIFRLEFNHEKE